MKREKIIFRFLHLFTPFSRLFPGGFENFLLKKRREGRKNGLFCRGLFFLYDLHVALALRTSGLFVKSLFRGTSPRFREMQEASPFFALSRRAVPLLSALARFLVSEAYYYAKTGYIPEEGALPSPLFSPQRYLEVYSDVKEKGINPLYHYVTWGYREEREPFPLLALPMEREAYYSYCNSILKRLKVVNLSAKTLSATSPFSWKKEKKIAVHLHCFYPEMLPSFIRFLKNIPIPFDLFLSLREGENGESYRRVFTKGLPLMRELFWEAVPNRGRDMAPLLCTFGERIAAEYDIFCHIHTKQSPHDRRLRNWTNSIMQLLLGSRKNITGIFSLLEKDARIVYPAMLPEMEPDPLTFWSINALLAEGLLQKAGKSIQDHPVTDFPHGNMFWAKSEYLRPLLQLGVSWDDFPEEPIEEDGSTAHILEHIQLILTEDMTELAICLHQKLPSTPSRSCHKAPGF